MCPFISLQPYFQDRDKQNVNIWIVQDLHYKKFKFIFHLDHIHSVSERLSVEIQGLSVVVKRLSVEPLKLIYLSLLKLIGEPL